jgi:acetylxylan esterase
VKRWIPARRPSIRPDVRRPGRRVAVYAVTATACLSIAALAAPTASAAAPPASGCAAVNLIVARASTEAPGEGVTQTLATQIVNSSKQTVSQEAVVYPATLTNYTSSESLGVTNAEQELTTAVDNCPNQKEVLLGYSQGAEVSMDVVAGNSEVGGTVPPVSTAISSHVVAIANFGDPGHVVGEPWDLGTATLNGLFPRGSAQLTLLAAFGGSSKIAAWCDFNDPFCASGINLTVHLTYLDRYQNAAASFVLGKIGG